MVTPGEEHTQEGKASGKGVGEAEQRGGGADGRGVMR